MYNDYENIKLGDVINRKFINDLLSTFSKSAGLASVCMDAEKNFTNEIGFTDFYNKIIKNSPECAMLSLEKRIKSGEESVETGEPCIFECACGLKNFTVPILIDNKHFGSIVCGQILTEAPNKEKFTTILNSFGLDYNDYAEELSKVKVITEERLKEIANYIHEVATTFSSVSTINSQKEKQQKLLLTLLRATDINYNIDDIVKIALKDIAEIFKIERAMIVSYQEDIPTIEYDYRTSEDVSDIKAICTKEEYDKVFDTWKLFLYQSGGDIHFNDIDEINVDKKTKELYKKTGLKSAMAYLMRTEGKLRIVILAKYKERHVWTKQQNIFLKLVSEQLSVAINQAELKTRMKKVKALQVALLKSLPFPAWVKDLNGKYLDANKLFLKLANIKNNSVIGYTDDKIWEDEETARQYKEYDKQVLGIKEPITVEREFKVNKYTYSDRIYLAPVFADNNKKDEILAIFGVVIERKM